MKKLLILALLFSSITATAQNIVYFERLNDLTEFSVGQGSVEIHTVGVHPLMNVFVSYDQNVAGSPVPTGWIPLSALVLTDVFGTEVDAIGIMPSGDTLIKTHQIITPSTSYEIAGITPQGFNSDGQWSNQAWEFQTSFTGPDLNCDATNVDDFLGFTGGLTCVNNELLIAETSNWFQYFAFGRVFYNQDNSYFSYFVLPINGYTNPTNLTGTYLNAYIPRVVNRPSSEVACDGTLNFERVAMVGDVVLQYAINGSAFSLLSTDQLTNVCANDTIQVIGISPTITPGDTLVQMQYVFKSALNASAIDFDLSRMNIALNANTTGFNCLNEITLENSNGGGSMIGLGFVLDEEQSQMELYLLPIEPIVIPNQCQQKYLFCTFASGESEFNNYFSYTILDQNNLTHGSLLDLEVTNIHSALGDCKSDLKIVNTGQNVPADFSAYRWDISGGAFQGVAEGNSIMDPADTIEMNNTCSKLYSFNYEMKHMELYIVTDSLQKISYAEHSTKIATDSDSDGYQEEIYTLHNIDTITHYWEECTNDYSLPFTTVVYDDNNLVNQIDFKNAIDFRKYESNFSLTQSATNITLPYREVLAPVYYDPANFNPAIPYYIVGELYCTVQKSIVKRRRIILGPDGSIQDIYGAAYSNVASIEAVEFDVFPNPANDQLTIESANVLTAYAIYDLNGRELLSKKVNNTIDTIDISSLPTGTYLISVEENGFTARKRFVKL